MNCSEFDIELEQLVESRGGTLTDPAVAHAAACAGCRQRWCDQRLIDAALLAWRPVRSSDSMTESVLGQLLGEPTRPASSPHTMTRAEVRLGWMAVSAAAACLLTVLGIGMATRSGPIDRGLARQQIGHPTRMIQPPVPVSDPVEVASTMAAVLNDLRTGYRELAAETSATAREFAVVLPETPAAPWAELGLSDTGSKTVGSTDHSSGNAADKAPPGTVSVIGRSIGTQIGQAMDFLRVAVPESVPRG